MTRYPRSSVLLIQGTHGWGRNDEKKEWWYCTSPFCDYLRGNQFAILGEGKRQFFWNTNLDGTTFLRRSGKLHINWQDAGDKLYGYLVPAMLQAPFNPDDYVPIAHRNLIVHSHGMQIVAYACAFGLKVNRLLTIGSPVRQDMLDIYASARPNIGAWLHVHSDGSDRIQWFGELFDGHLGIVRELPASLRARNLRIANVAHSKLLRDEASFPLWHHQGLFRFLRGAD